MSTLITLVVVALKAAVSGSIENEIISALAEQGIEISSDKFKEYAEKTQREVNGVLSDKNLREMNILANHTEYVRAEIKEMFRKVDVSEEMFRKCKYDADTLAESIYSKYRKQNTYSNEYEGEIRTVLSAMCGKVISLEKGREGFIEDGIIQLISSVEEIKGKLSSQDEISSNRIKTIEFEKDSECKMRLPDRTEEYYRKWTENMFLNNFDEDDEDAGINIPLRKLYQPLFYRLKGQKKVLSNLEERLSRCTRGQDLKNRMLLILGQPGMGKSTVITWFLDWYPKKSDANRNEILVYRFTDLNIKWGDSSIGEKKGKESIDRVILECLNMEKQDLNGKILILDGFDEVAVGNNRMEILNCLYDAWARDTRIEEFSLLVTCRENYIEDLSRLSFPYITLQPWNEEQIDSFCRKYEALTKSWIFDEAIDKMKEMKNTFGIPIILYMTLALEITVKYESSVVEVYDQIFSLIYDRCLKSDASVRCDDEHRIVEIKEQIHQFSREISMWMFENNSEKAAIPRNEYEKIRDEIFTKDNGGGDPQRKDVLIGNYFRRVHYYNGIDTEQLTFVHRSIYEYFVADTIYSEIRDAAADMTGKSQEKLAGRLGCRLKKGRIGHTIGEYLKAKIKTLIKTYSEEKRIQFYIWLEGTIGKMLDAGMLYYTEENIKKYRNVIEKELKCFSNLLAILRPLMPYFWPLSKYFLQNVDQEKMTFYVSCLIGFSKIKDEFIIDLSRIYLAGADLRGAELIGANLRGANLRGADLRRANLRGADLSAADIAEADLIGAELIGTNLSVVDLSGSDLRDADLSGSDLSGSDLRGTNLRGSDLRNVYLDFTKWYEEDVDQYISCIKQAKFNMIYLYSKETGEKRKLTFVELLSRYPD